LENVRIDVFKVKGKKEALTEKNAKEPEELKMKINEELPNLGNSILSISGSDRGVHLFLVGSKESLIEILGIALMQSQELAAILAGLKNGHNDGECERRE
jgi:hypothetical protein